MISFIIIGKNEDWRLKKCFDSIIDVIRQDKISSYEIIYVDSKSTDNSLILAKSYKEIHSFLVTGECNAAVARNIGEKVSHGNILFFIDGDMEIFPGFLPKIITDENTLSYPFISGIFDDINYNETWKYESTSRRHKLSEGDPDSFESVTGGLFLIQRNLWEMTRGMDTRFKRSQDFDLGLRLSSMGYKLCRKAIYLAKHHTQTYTIRPHFLTNIKYTGLILRKHFYSKSYLPIFAKQQYTTIILLLCIFCSFVVRLHYGWIIYLLCIAYKTRNQYKKLWYRNLLIPCYKDVLLIFSFLFFHPKKIEEKYTKIL